MTTLISEPESTSAAAPSCPAWCLGAEYHEETATASCASAVVGLASGVEAWVTGVPGEASRVVICGVAPELDADAPADVPPPAGRPQDRS